LGEVERAFNNCDAEQVMAEVVDVANFCMMIHDKLRRQMEEKT
jgi:hypothetical protein